MIDTATHVCPTSDHAADSVEQALRGFIAAELLFSGHVYPYPDQASFLDHGIVDSLGIMSLVAFVEERFGLSVADADIVPANFDSVSRLSAYIRAQR
jgi:acyl carrier protein